jgi:hypothetical protein
MIRGCGYVDCDVTAHGGVVVQGTTHVARCAPAPMERVHNVGGRWDVGCGVRAEHPTVVAILNAANVAVVSTNRQVAVPIERTRLGRLRRAPDPSSRNAAVEGCECSDVFAR